MLIDDVLQRPEVGPSLFNQPEFGASTDFTWAHSYRYRQVLLHLQLGFVFLRLWYVVSKYLSVIKQGAAGTMTKTNSRFLFTLLTGLHQLLWYFSDLEKRKCFTLPGDLPDWKKNPESCAKWRRFAKYIND